MKIEVLSFAKKKSWQAALQTIKESQNTPTGTHKNSQILLYRFLDEYT